jgi:hypothetical protein
MVTIHIKYYSTLIGLLFTLNCCGQHPKPTTDPNLKMLYKVFDQIKSGKYEKNKLYLDYFMQATKEGYDRSSADKIFYKDTLFVEYHKALENCTQFRILPLKEAKKTIGDSIVEKDYYYDSQQNSIYVMTIDNKKRSHDIVSYFLVTDGKIVSLVGITQDNKLIGWR